MKNFSKAIVLSVTMLVAGNAFALTKQDANEIVARVAKLGVNAEDLQKVQKALDDKYLKSYMLTTDVRKVRAFVLSCPALIGTEATLSAKTVAALKVFRTHAAAEKAMLVAKISEATNATLAEVATEELTKLIKDIDALLARIEKNWTIKPFKGKTNPFQNRKFEKVTEAVILNDAIYNRIAAAKVA